MSIEINKLKINAHKREKKYVNQLAIILLAL